MKALKLSSIVVLALFLCVACTTTEQTNSNANRANANANANAGTPPQVVVINMNQSTQANSNASESGVVSTSTDGPTLFAQQNCGMCHGADSKGNPKMKNVPDLTNAQWQRKESDEDFIKVIKDGKKPMPAYGSKLNDEQIKALVAHVRSFAR